MGELSILAHTGALKFTWDPAMPDEIMSVKKHFEIFLEENYSAFILDNNRGEGKKISAFDPSAEKIIMIPKLGGG